MPTYGVTAAGFVRKPLSVIREEVQALMRAKFGQNIPLDASSIEGQWEGVISDIQDQLWELLQAVYSSRDPDAAEGAALDTIAAYSGTVRSEARKSTVDLLWEGTPGSVISIGAVARTAGGTRFLSTAAGTIPGGGSITLAAESADYGPIPALAGTIVELEAPIAGVASVTNPLDAVLGALEEGDAAFRSSREDKLRAAGAAAVSAIRARLLNVDDVTDAMVFSNRGDATDADGLPGHSIEALVTGGTDAAIREAIFAATAGGIYIHGTISGTVVDEVGDSHTIRHSRPTDFDVYVKITLSYDANAYPSDGDAQVIDKLVTFGDTYLSAGRDVVPGALAAQAYQVDGVVEVSSLTIAVVAAGAAAPADGAYSTARYVMSVRQRGLMDSSRVQVTSTAGTV